MQELGHFLVVRLPVDQYVRQYLLANSMPSTRYVNVPDQFCPDSSPWRCSRSRPPVAVMSPDDESVVGSGRFSLGLTALLGLAMVVLVLPHT
jgi:hypothetical protein